MSTNARVLKQELDEIELVNISTGNGEEILGWYSFTPSKTGNPKSFTYTKNGSIFGEYVGSYQDKTYGKNVYKVRTAEGLVALNTASDLDRAMLQVPVGAMVKITYKGKEGFKDKQGRAKTAHRFQVSASKKA